MPISYIAFGGGENMPPVDEPIVVIYSDSDSEYCYWHAEVCIFHHEAFGVALYRQDPNDGYGKKLDRLTATSISENGYWVTVRDFVLGIMDQQGIDLKTEALVHCINASDNGIVVQEAGNDTVA